MSMCVSKVTINTGNVLNLIDIKKKAGQNVTEELSESIKLTLSEWGNQNGTVQNGSSSEDFARTSTQSDYMVFSATAAPQTVVHITRPYDDVQNKMAEEERKNLKIGVKIFINEDCTIALTECLENAFTALQTQYIDNVTLAYNPDLQSLQEADEDSNHVVVHATKASPISLGGSTVHVSSEMLSDNEAESKKSAAVLSGIKVLWAVLEDYVKKNRIGQLGVADLGLPCLRALHASCAVPPAIAQINLASCCVVPPALHAYCRDNDVQLLTHADPPDLLSKAALKTLTDVGSFCNSIEWVARYQVHIKCRGVLALKGYVCKATIGNC